MPTRIGGIAARPTSTPDGTVARPNLVLLDDPQTDTQAYNPNQVGKPEVTIEQSVMGLVEPDKKLTVFMACTVIYEGGFSDTYPSQPTKHSRSCGRKRGVRYRSRTIRAAT